jgi:hypothetical protein
MTNGQNKNSNKITLEDFNADEKSLLAKGIIAIILANEEVTSAEIKYLKKHCSSFLEDVSMISEDQLKKYIKNKDKADFWKHKISSHKKIHFMLRIFVKTIFSDNGKAQSEIDAFFEMGKKMGVSFYVLNEMIQIEGSRFQLYTREKSMLEELKKVFKK